MDELEIIDEDDLVGATGYKGESVYIGNAHLVYSSAEQSYRLYMTEVTGGLFVLDFTHAMGRGEINILSLAYVDLRSLL